MRGAALGAGVGEVAASGSGAVTFARTAELNSLSAAGRELRLSAAVVSSRIAKLEKQLGVRLLNRMVQDSYEG